MKLQQHSNRNRSPNLNERGSVKVNPHLAKKEARIGSNKVKGKKAFAQFIPWAILGVILIIGAGYFLLTPKEVQGTPVPNYQPPQAKVETPQTNHCGEGMLLDNSGKCIVPPCPSGSARDNTGNCVLINQNVNPGYNPAPLDKPCTPTGYFKSAYVREKNYADFYAKDIKQKMTPISYQFVATNECEANFYIEAGVRESPSKLTILVTQPSACDGNPHYAGKFVKGNKNTQFASNVPAGVIDVAFFPDAYGGDPDELYVTGGVYSGCLKDGGNAIAEIPPKRILLSSRFSANDVSSSWKKII